MIFFPAIFQLQERASLEGDDINDVPLAVGAFFRYPTVVSLHSGFVWYLGCVTVECFFLIGKSPRKIEWSIVKMKGVLRYVPLFRRVMFHHDIIILIILLVVYSKQVASHLTLQGVFSVESKMPRSTRKPLHGLNATEARMRRQDVCDLLRRQKLVGGFKYFLFSSLFGDMIQIDSYFWDGLKPPTRKTMGEGLGFLRIGLWMLRTSGFEA